MHKEATVRQIKKIGGFFFQQKMANAEEVLAISHQIYEIAQRNKCFVDAMEWALTKGFDLSNLDGLMALSQKHLEDLEGDQLVDIAVIVRGIRCCYLRRCNTRDYEGDISEHFIKFEHYLTRSG